MKKELFRQFDFNRLVFEDAPAEPQGEAAPEAPKEEKVGFFAKLFGGGKKAESAAPEAPAAEAPVEPAAEEAPAAEAAPATCPNCGGEMAEGHTCPAPAAEEAPTEEAPAEEAAPAEGGDQPQ